MGEIQLSDLTKVYSGDVRAVDGVDVTIEDGEFFSLLGPSGCGKTTTLRMIAGFETPTDGRVAIDGDDVTSDPPEDRPTNMVFQNLALFSHMNVYDNVAYGLERSGLDDAEIEERVHESLELVDMPGYEDRRVTELSGGQQQRIALARALTNRTDVILLDEPLASLDRKLRQQMQLELRNIHEEVGMTFFYVTHDQQAAMTMSDRMAVMNDGRIEQVGAPEAVYDEPANEFVADFIGDVNTFSGAVTGGRFEADTGESFALPSSASTDDGDATLVVRPEKFQISSGSLAVENTLDGRVVERVFRGPSTRYDVEWRDRVLSVESQNATGTPPHESGDRVVVGWPTDAGIVYRD